MLRQMWKLLDVDGEVVHEPNEVEVDRLHTSSFFDLKGSIPPANTHKEVNEVCEALGHQLLIHIKQV